MARNVLQIAQDAAVKLGLEKPDSLFSTTDVTAMQLAGIANEVAERIARLHDWRALTELGTLTGDGVTAAFNMPPGYNRMTKDGKVWSSRTKAPLTAIRTVDEWLALQVEGVAPAGAWIILSDQINFNPVLASGETAKFYFVKRNISKRLGQTNTDTFQNDTDEFRLGSRLLELHIICEWRLRKGFDYEDDYRTAQVALSQAISHDKGARIVRQQSRIHVDAQTAYPWAL